jgi:oxygen-independent coproporphyrinogen-3 oxidase
VYIHVPFCERKCSYCDFYSIEGMDLRGQYFNALKREIARAAHRGSAASADSIYIGGGTPSLLTAMEIERMLKEIGRHFRVAPDAEVSIEVNPGTTTRDSLREMRRLGVNRLSIGVQSFDDRALSFLGRIHSVDDGRTCIASARAAGFDNISIDLIFAIPGQPHEEWMNTLNEAVALAPEHISAYSLIVEEQTPLYGLVQAGKVVPVAEEEEASQFMKTMQVLEESGYDHYEVSNYSRSGHRSRHNTAYWHHHNYLGFGPSAHSFWADAMANEAWRWANVRDVSGYCEALSRQGSPVAMAEELGLRDLINERIFLSLRSDGLLLPALSSELGYELSGEQRAYIHQILARNLAVLKDGVVRLTREGFLLCDEICSQLMIS